MEEKWNKVNKSEKISCSGYYERRWGLRGITPPEAHIEEKEPGLVKSYLHLPFLESSPHPQTSAWVFLGAAGCCSQKDSQVEKVCLCNKSTIIKESKSGVKRGLNFWKGKCAL